MNILEQKAVFCNQLLAAVPRKIHSLFTFGFWSLTEERITSIRGNARQVVQNSNTAKTKAWRLLKNGRFTNVLPHLLVQLKLVSSTSIICLDFSDFHGWQVLVFAIQTHHGRAVPVYFEILKYPITKGSQNLFIIAAIEHFVSFVGCRPKLVMDRGFACPWILRHLAQQSHLFVVRVKGGKQFRNQRNRLFKARSTHKNDQRMSGYTKHLRLVVSDKLSGMPEAWFLVTNDFCSTREELVTDYYHRFEIEEFFKDAKWLLGLEHVRFLKQQSMAIVLWFVVLGMWFTERLRHTEKEPTWKTKDTVSFTRYVFEQLQRAKNELVTQFLNQELVRADA
jgi:hypothetical protein